jgi:hypothetical protein
LSLLQADLCLGGGHLVADAAGALGVEGFAVQRVIQSTGKDATRRSAQGQERDAVAGPAFDLAAILFPYLGRPDEEHLFQAVFQADIDTGSFGIPIGQHARTTVPPIPVPVKNYALEVQVNPETLTVNRAKPESST